MYLVEQQVINDKRSLRNWTKKIAERLIRNHTTRGRLVTERWIRNHTTRRRLSELDDNSLRDVGIDPIAAAQEARKPFWQN